MWVIDNWSTGMKGNCLLLAALSFLVVQSPAQAITAEIELGLKHMKLRNYKVAAGYFHRAALAKPEDPVARYHLANSLVYLKRHDQAIAEYRRSLELDPYSIVSGYCKRALISYKTALPAVNGAELSLRQKRLKQMSSQANRAVSMIRRQVNDEKVRHHEYASCLSKNVIRAGGVRTKKIKEDADHKIKLLYDYGPLMKAGSGFKRPGRSYGTLNPYLQKLVRDEADEIRKQAEADIKTEQKVAEKRSAKIQEWSQSRRETLDSVADNLEDQMAADTNPSGIELNPVGTGLYVRNYQSTKNKKRKIPDAKFSVARFVDKLENTELEPIDTDDSDVKRQESVRGEVVNFTTQGS